MFPIEARFAHPGAGWPGESEQARDLLTPGRVYTVSRLDVGRSSSALYLLDFPDVPFNTVLFDAEVQDYGAEDDEPPPADPASVPDGARKAAHDATSLPLDQAMRTSPYELIDMGLDAATPVIRADERARIRSLLPYNVNCCEVFPAAVADLIGEHGE